MYTEPEMFITGNDEGKNKYINFKGILKIINLSGEKIEIETTN